MAQETFQDLCKTLNRPALVSPTGSICALGGQPIDIVGETEILVTGAGPISVMIARSIPHELLLGSDSIERGNGVLDYKHETMILVLEPPPRLDPEPVASPDHEATETDDSWVAHPDDVDQSTTTPVPPPTVTGADVSSANNASGGALTGGAHH